jgi:hypothetical protein
MYVWYTLLAVKEELNSKGETIIDGSLTAQLYVLGYITITDL